jgi:hypothetical protein
MAAYINFKGESDSNIENPSSDEGRLFYNYTEKSFKVKNDEGDIKKFILEGDNISLLNIGDGLISGGDNISLLNNDSSYINSSQVPVDNISLEYNTDGTISVITSSNTLNLSYRAVSISTQFTDTDYILEATNSDITISLPSAIGRTGRIYLLDNSSSGNIVLNCSIEGQTVGGSTQITVYEGEVIEVYSNNTSWRLI